MPSSFAILARIPYMNRRPSPPTNELASVFAERIHTAPKRKESTTALSNRNDEMMTVIVDSHDSVAVDCFTVYADGYFYHFLILRSPWQHDAATPSSEPHMSRHTFHAVHFRYGCWQHLGDAAMPSSEAKASSRRSVLQDPLFAARAISLLNDRELGAIGRRRSHLRK